MSLLLARRRPLLFPSAAVAASYAAEVLADSPLSYWRLEETSGSTVADEQGARTGTVYGADLSASGRVGSAVSFDGVDDYLALGDSPQNMPALTVEAILSATNTDADGGQILTADVSSSTRAWQFRVNSSGLEFIKIANGVVTASAAASLLTGAFFHVAGTYDGSWLRVYINGVEEGSAAASGAITPGLDVPLTSGGRNSLIERLTGTVDELALYNAALPASRVLAHAQAAGVA